MKAIWNKQVIAESNDIINIEGNSYFPIDSVKKEYLKKSSTKTMCQRKGIASYYDLEIDGVMNKDAVWYYPSPKDFAKGIKNRVAFWKEVQVLED